MFSKIIFSDLEFKILKERTTFWYTLLKLQLGFILKKLYFLFLSYNIIDLLFKTYPTSIIQLRVTL